MKRLLLLALLVAAACTSSRPLVNTNAPVIRVPHDGERIGSLRMVHAEGSVPEGRIGIFAVEPLNASPTIWIQPFAPSVSGGPVSATIYLGTLTVGGGEHYRIYLLACKANHGLRVGEETTLQQIQPVCEWGRPVTVYRER